ncbi:hypothetical protein EVAR_14392_1 [Eumeta japonica]|uniref:Uncharacterized protein n=1 Tax=Eumeta variegata TaxID=151549 RepID=A0A4C1TX64_EUMVA|nr:hypothetical protein EVAR_14392_1 [Eumeta japonica]
MSRGAAPPAPLQNRFCEELSTIGHSHCVGCGVAFVKIVRAARAPGTVILAGRARPRPSPTGFLCLFPYDAVAASRSYSGTRSVARSRPSITSWRAGSASCTCSSIPIGRLGLIRKGARRGNGNKTRPMEVLPHSTSTPVSRSPHTSAPVPSSLVSRPSSPAHLADRHRVSSTGTLTRHYSRPKATHGDRSTYTKAPNGERPKHASAPAR